MVSQTSTRHGCDYVTHPCLLVPHKGCRRCLNAVSGIWWGVLGLEWVAEAAELDGVEGWAEVGVVVLDAGLAYGLAELAGGFVALAGADVGEGVEDCFGEFVLAGGEAAVGVAESDGVLVVELFFYEFDFVWGPGDAAEHAGEFDEAVGAFHLVDEVDVVVLG